MTVPNPEHLFDQAQKLIEMPTFGRPRQVDIRRAISSAYYALFHAALTEASDGMLGAANRTSERYRLVYRSVDHRGLRRLCEELQKSELSDRYRRLEPAGGFASAIKQFAAAVLELQQKRHSADYDPLIRWRRSDAQIAINGGREALARFQAADDAQRQTFGSLLLFSPR